MSGSKQKTTLDSQLSKAETKPGRATEEDIAAVNQQFIDAANAGRQAPEAEAPAPAPEPTTPPKGD